MRFTFSLACAAVAASLFAAAAPATHAEGLADNLVTSGKLTIGTTGSSPPSTMYDENAELTGLDIDLAKKIAKDLGLEPEFVVLDWSGMLAGVQSNRFDMVASSVARTPERVASADFFVTQAYVANGTGAAMHKDTTDIKDWKDLCGKQLGIVKGATQIKALAKKFGDDCIGTPREYPGWTELLLDLQNKRIDALVGNYITPAYLIQSTDRPLAMLSTSLDVGGNALVIQPGNKPLAEKIDALIEGYKKDGSLEAITKKWVGKPLPLDSIGK
ncbi:substrate-binding periplasmic protein [Rhizobium halophytocola]|uniref:Cystine transport system substrate-binding protein n=1 Tax=Rhizobium halophytocola TaxID=735519 RepID=A0ABS4DUR7_9HYPH|nr:ABC transporter substrate-binding protein [Rhizobium halophytocola]MBP1849364.1 cystine transport system substrate-binding protein [Rhizobium halophytocola]